MTAKLPLYLLVAATSAIAVVTIVRLALYLPISLDQEVTNFLLLFVIVALGALMGLYVQHVMTLMRGDGEYKRMSPRRISGLRQIGLIAALVAGVTFLGVQGDALAKDVVWQCWGIQLTASAGGLLYLRKYIPKETDND